MGQTESLQRWELRHLVLFCAFALASYTVHLILVCLLAPDLSSSKRGLILFRKGLEFQLQGLVVRFQCLEFAFHSLSRSRIQDFFTAVRRPSHSVSQENISLQIGVSCHLILGPFLRIYDHALLPIDYAQPLSPPALLSSSRSSFPLGLLHHLVRTLLRMAEDLGLPSSRRESLRRSGLQRTPA